MRKRGISGSPDALALTLSVGLTALFFSPLLGGATFSTVAGHHQAVYPWRAFDPEFLDYPQSDQADLSYPWQAFISRSLRAGSFPFWNPDSFGGQPFFANGSSAVLYPPRLVAALLLPPDWAHDVLSIFHLLLAGVSMWLLLRELRLGVLASLMGSAAWMLSPFNMAWLHLEVVAPAAAWLPLSLLLVNRAVERESWRDAGAAAVALACTLVSGHLLFMGLVYGVAVSYGAVLALWRLPRDRSRRSGLLRLLLIAVGPLALGAVVLVPTVTFLHGLGREPLAYDAVNASIRVPYRVFLTLLQPPRVPPVTERQMHEMAYVGRALVPLAVIGFFTRRGSAWLGRALSLGTLLIATDTLGLKLIYAILPQFSFFSPLGRLLNLFNFGVVLLAAIGLDAVVSLARGRAGPSNPRPDPHARDGTPHTALRSLILARSAVVLAAAVILLTSIELVRFAWRVNPPFPPREAKNLYPRTPVIRSLAVELSRGYNGRGRILPLRGSQARGWMPPILYGAESMLFGFDSAGGYDSTLPSRSETVWRIVAGEPLESVLAARYRRAFSASFEVRNTRFDLLPRFGVTTIVASPEVADEPDWERREFAPLNLQSVYNGIDGRIHRIVDAPGGPQVVWRVQVADRAEHALRKVLEPAFDHRSQVVLERDHLPMSIRPGATAPTFGFARVLSEGVNDEEIRVVTDGQAWVVIPNNWDPGWRAWVDGDEVPVVRANYVHQAVQVPAGASRVRLAYRPRGFGLGLAVSLAAGLGTTALLVGGRRSPSPVSRARG